MHSPPSASPPLCCPRPDPISVIDDLAGRADIERVPLPGVTTADGRPVVIARYRWRTTRVDAHRQCRRCGTTLPPAQSAAVPAAAPIAPVIPLGS